MASVSDEIKDEFKDEIDIKDEPFPWECDQVCLTNIIHAINVHCIFIILYLYIHINIHLYKYL